MEPKRRYFQKVTKPFHISMASMDLSACTKEPVQLMVHFQSRNYLLCTLQKSGPLQVRLDLNFEAGDEVSFIINGQSHVHLSGYHLEDDYIDADSDNEGEEEEEETEETEEKTEEAEAPDVSLSNIVYGKRKQMKSEGPSSLLPVAKRSKTLQLLAEAVEASDDDEDDEDVTFSDLEDDDDDDEGLTLESIDDESLDEDDGDSSFVDLEDEEEDDDGEEEQEDEEEDDSDEELEKQLVEKQLTKKEKNKLKQQQQQAANQSQQKSPEKQPKKQQKENKQNKKGEQQQQQQVKKDQPQAQMNGTTPTSEKKKRNRNKKNKSQQNESLNTTGKDVKQEQKTPKNEKKQQQQQQSQQKASPKTFVDRGVSIEEIVVGSGNQVKNGKIAHVYYEGRLKQNKKMFDNCLKGAPFKFRVGNKEVIAGWDVGVVGMKVGGKRRITIPSNLAYGIKGAKPDIPANAALVFDIELKNLT